MGLDNANNGKSIQLFTKDNGSNTHTLNFDGSGNLGINTTDPSAVLHVFKDILDDASYNTFPTSSSGSTLPKSTTFYAGDNTWGLAMGTTFTGGRSYIQTFNSGSATYYDLLLQPSGGKVGIGTSSPQEELHIYFKSYSNYRITDPPKFSKTLIKQSLPYKY